MRSDDLILADAYLQMEEYKQILQRILDNIEKKWYTQAISRLFCFWRKRDIL